MNIIEKLGIKPVDFNEIVFNITEQERKSVIDCKYLRILEATQKVEHQRNDLLEVLITYALLDEKEGINYPMDAIEVIEKTTDKTWEEIKELL